MSIFDIGGIVDDHRLNFLFAIKFILTSSWKPDNIVYTGI
jgi:hypothetical protein